MEIGRQVVVYSKEDVKLELAGRLLADLLRLSALYGGEAPFLLVGLTPPPMPGKVGPSFNRQPHELSVYDIDVERLPVGQLVMALYEYAYHQTFPIGMDFHVLSAEMEMVEDLVLYLQSGTYSLFLGDYFHMQEANQHDWEALPTVYSLANARLLLDSGEALSLQDIALLADMAEKSVRNALTASGEGHLSMQQNLVDNAEARRWLSLRRNFRATVFSEVGIQLHDHPAALNSLLDLGNFIHARWQALHKEPSDVLRELDWPAARLDYLNGVISNAQTIDPKDCAGLAKSLVVDEAWFTSQVFRNLFPQQVALLLAREKDAPVQTLSHRLDDERMCLRVAIRLKDDTVLHPIRMKNRATGSVAFRLSKGGTGGNTLENTIEVDDEAQMIELFCGQGYAVRASSPDGATHGLYRKNGRSVSEVRLDGTPVARGAE